MGKPTIEQRIQGKLALMTKIPPRPGTNAYIYLRQVLGRRKLEKFLTLELAAALLKQVPSYKRRNLNPTTLTNEHLPAVAEILSEYWLELETSIPQIRELPSEAEALLSPSENAHIKPLRTA